MIMNDITAEKVISEIVLCLYKGHEPTSLVLSQELSEKLQSNEHYEISDIDGRHKFLALPVTIAIVDSFKILY